MTKQLIIFSSRQKDQILTGRACVDVTQASRPIDASALIGVVSAIICPSLYAFVSFPPPPPPLLVQTSLCQGLPDKRWHTKLQTQCKIEI